MNKELFSRQFPMGSHLCRKPMPPMGEMKHDMEVLKKHGFNLIKIQTHWGLDEKTEGVIDTEAYEELISHAATLDMGVYVGLTNEQAPNWLWEKFPDCRMVGRDGVPIAYQAQYTLPADGKPGPCYDHAGAMAAQLLFTARFVYQLSGYENIVMWNTWQEVGYWDMRIVGKQVCYCEHTLNFFRAWLKEKYSSDLDALNRALSTNYADWKAILPERGNRLYHLPMDAEWTYFMNHVQVGNVLKQRCEVIKGHDLYGRPVFAHKGSPEFSSSMDRTYARCQDFLGSSCYPAWGSGDGKDDMVYDQNGQRDKADALSAEAFNIGLNFDYLRSLNRLGAPLYAAELQGGPVSTGFHLGRVPSPQDIRRWMLGLLGTGVTGISFWVTRAEIMAGEMNGFGLLDDEGDTSERLCEAKRIAEFINKHPALFNTPKGERANVGILVDEDNYNGCSRLAQGGDGHAYSMRGWYRYMTDVNADVDFVCAEDLGEEFIRQYKMLILPFPVFMSDTTAERLRHYVEGGGTLVSEATPGRITDHGKTRRTMMTLCDVFGVKHHSLKMVSEPGYAHRFTPPPRTWGEYLDPAEFTGAGAFAGHTLRANLYVQSLEPAGAEPIFTADEMITGTLHRYGKGTAILLGTYIGHNATAYRNVASHSTVKKLLSLAGVEHSENNGVTLRERSADGKTAYIIFNATAETKTVPLPASTLLDSYGGSVSAHNGTLTAQCPPLDTMAVVVR